MLYPQKRQSVFTADSAKMNFVMTGQMHSSSLPDAVPRHWTSRYLPPWARPYVELARLDRPIGWWLLLWPCWWSLTLAARSTGEAYPDPFLLLLFLVGAIVMRGAGCTYNDILDRRIDAQVERTRSRPLPSGRISIQSALLFMFFQLGIGFIVLMEFNSFTQGVGAASLLVIAVYPFMKRITHYPQAVLGLGFSWGALLGWSAVFGALAFPPLLLYGAAVFWTIGYDTIYAHQDREDDALIGVRSTALRYGRSSRLFIVACYSLTALLMAGALYTAGAGLFAYLGLAAFASHLLWQALRFTLDKPELYLRLFRSNRTAGALLFIGLLFDAAEPFFV